MLAVEKPWRLARGGGRLADVRERDGWMEPGVVKRGILGSADGMLSLS
jgi:hypothetical protein